jgi:hypothetical protein
MKRNFQRQLPGKFSPSNFIFAGRHNAKCFFPAAESGTRNARGAGVSETFSPDAGSQ